MQSLSIWSRIWEGSEFDRFKVALGGGSVAMRNNSSAAQRSEAPHHVLPLHPYFQRVDRGGSGVAPIERTASCTAFQTFDWLAAWQKHIGQRRGVRPAVAVGFFAGDETAFILPLCVMRGRLVARLCWLGQDLCDYNAPLLAPDFSQRVPPEGFLAAWHELQVQMQCEPELRHDWIEFEKMPETVGAQTNPFMYLGVSPNRNSAHLAHPGDDWEQFYHAKRSSATRRRDRAKRRHMCQFGDIRFVSAASGEDARQTLEILMDQKGRALIRKGLANIFAPADHREFFLTSHLIREPGISLTQPRRDRQRLRGGESRHRIRRLLLSRARKLCGQRSRAIWTGRPASA